jgi:hypothetical protein
MTRAFRLIAIYYSIALFATACDAPAFGQAASWLSDERAREIASEAIHSEYPEPCYSTYRQEGLESLMASVRKNRLVGNHVNNSVYFYRVASDACDYVVEKDGKQVLLTRVSMDCCEYGIVAVDRETGKSYWFGGRRKASDIFRKFVRDEQLEPDTPNPRSFTGLYLELVWGEYRDKEIESLEQLQGLVESNFQSAYSPYQRDNSWQRKFEPWWKRFRSRMPQLRLQTTYESTFEGTIVRGYGFSGFQLTIPRSDPPPKGMPQLFQWALLIKPDGTIEEKPSKAIYSSR